jgi:hypothetical protein
MRKSSKKQKIKHVLLGLSSAASLATLAASSGAFHVQDGSVSAQSTALEDSCKLDDKGACTGTCTTNKNYSCQLKSNICGCFPN